MTSLLTKVSHASAHFSVFQYFSGRASMRPDTFIITYEFRLFIWISARYYDISGFHLPHALMATIDMRESTPVKVTSLRRASLAARRFRP